MFFLNVFKQNPSSEQMLAEGMFLLEPEGSGGGNLDAQQQLSLGFLVAKVYKKYENRGILGVKKYVNVYRFLRKYSVFFISTVCFLSSRFCCFRSRGNKKSAISGTLLKENGDIALRKLSVNLITYGLCFFTLR